MDPELSQDVSGAGKFHFSLEIRGSGTLLLLSITIYYYY